MITRPEIFIIESLNPDDEGNGRFESAIISRMLSLHGKACRYRYVRTRTGFESALKQFGRSKYRYLHISCHADPGGMCTTNQDEIAFDELGRLLKPYISGRRLFLSACEMVHADLAKAVMRGSGCASVIGPNEKVRFSDAAILWSSLYHLMFTHSTKAMKHAELLKYLERASRMFQVNMSYFSKSKTARSGISSDFLRK